MRENLTVHERGGVRHIQIVHGRCGPDAHHEDGRAESGCRTGHENASDDDNGGEKQHERFKGMRAVHDDEQVKTCGQKRINRKEKHFLQGGDGIIVSDEGKVKNTRHHRGTKTGVPSARHPEERRQHDGKNSRGRDEQGQMAVFGQLVERDRYGFWRCRCLAFQAVIDGATLVGTIFTGGDQFFEIVCQMNDQDFVP